MLKSTIDVSPEPFAEFVARKPDWVKNNISRAEGAKLTAKILRSGSTSAIEIGVASGFSSAILYNAMLHNTAKPRLYSFDLSVPCYFDSTKKTGDAFYEMLGKQPGFQLSTGATSANIRAGAIDGPVDFVFIDASHKSPWPALDLLSAGRFMKAGTQIGLHDVDMIFKKDTWRWNNGPRDLYRSWVGRKHRFANTPNVGFLVYDGDPSQILTSVAFALTQDWDEAVDGAILTKFCDIASEYDADPKLIGRVSEVITARSTSWRFNKLSK